MFIRLVMVTMVLASSAGLANAETRADVAAGRRLAQANCGACHATGPSDVSPRPEAPLFRTLSEKYPIETLEEALGEGILVGHSDMPQVVFSPRDVTRLIAYLKSLQPMRPRVGP